MSADTDRAPVQVEPRRAQPRLVRFAESVARALGPIVGRERARRAVGWTYAVVTLVSYSIKVQYARAFLGMLWTLVAPALLVAVYLPVLSGNVDAAAHELLGPDRLAFPLYVVIGFLVYGAFGQAIQNGASSLALSPEVVHHSPIPLSILPLVKVAQAVVGLVFSLSVVLIVVIATSGWPGFRIVLVAPAMFFLFLTTLGIALVLSGIAVLFRDTIQILSALLLVEFFAVPIVYLPTSLTGTQALLMQANPLAPLLALFRAALNPHYPFAWMDLGLAAAWSVPLFVAGRLVFRRLGPAIVEHA